MFNVDSIGQFISEAERLAELDGNCGRVVRRFIERTFSAAGEAHLALHSSHGHLSLFAYRVSQMDWASFMANRVVAEQKDLGGEDYGLKFSLAEPDVRAGVVTIRVTATAIPEQLKERQAFLQLVAFGVRRFLTLALLNCQAEGLDEYIVQSCAEEGYTGMSQQEGLALFDKLMVSDFSQMRETPAVLVMLAEFLNPEVDAQRQVLDQEYDEIVENAFSEAFAFPLTQMSAAFTRHAQL